MATKEEAVKHDFQAEVTQVLNLVINSLYSNKEIFLRELVSNAADALDKLRFEAISKPELLDGDTELRIRITFDADAGTLSIWDNGIGMTEEELVQNLGTIAHSGSRDFLAQLKEAADAQDLNLIGQFGVGFYSGYLVADEVTVITRPAGQENAFRWHSDGTESFVISPAKRDLRGTTVTLKLKEEHKDYANRWQIQSLVGKYSDYVSHPIEMLSAGKGEDGEDAEPGFETVNQASALWQRDKEDITEEQYTEFFKHLAHDWEPPIGHAHFKIEGTQLFTGLLFLPKRPPFGLFDPDMNHGLRLHVKRVFVVEDCKELLPKWLRFMRGVIDSDDLPLNISRETLQDSRIVQTMRKQVVKKTLDLLDDVAENRPADYLEVWANYGAVLKEGLHFEPEHKDRLVKLIRYESTKGEGLVSLADYVERMPEGQDKIYYAYGPNRKLLENSPHLEVLKNRGYEVLLMTDGIDQWAVSALAEYEEKPLVSAMTAELDLNTESEEEKASAETFKSLSDHIKEVLSDHVSEVRVSSRLSDSPVCLVVPEGGMHAHIELLLRANGRDAPASKRILEINPGHLLIKNLNSLFEAKKDSDRVRDWIELLHDQALLVEGMPLEDPARFAGQMTRLMESAMISQVGN